MRTSAGHVNYVKRADRVLRWNDDIRSPKQAVHTVVHPLQEGEGGGRDCVKMDGGMSDGPQIIKPCSHQEQQRQGKDLLLAKNPTLGLMTLNLDIWLLFL